MQTRSSPIKILWSLAYVVVALVGLRVTAEPTSVQGPPRRDRTVLRKPWSVEPVKVVAAKNKKKDKIENDIASCAIVEVDENETDEDTLDGKINKSKKKIDWLHRHGTVLSVSPVTDNVYIRWDGRVSPDVWPFRAVEKVE